MLLDKETRTMMNEFNSNVRWLRENYGQIKQEGGIYASEWLGYAEVQRYLNRKKTWIRQHIIEPDKITGSTDLSLLFVKGVDVKLDGKYLRFKKSSVERVLNSLVS